MKNKRFKLLTWICTENGKYKQGQTGRILFEGDEYLVEFDGYEREKIEAEQFRMRFGECPNIVPYLTSIPKNIVEIIE